MNRSELERVAADDELRARIVDRRGDGGELLSQGIVAPADRCW